MKTGSCFLHTYPSYNKKTPINPNSPPLSQPHRMSEDNINKGKQKQINKEGME